MEWCWRRLLRVLKARPHSPHTWLRACRGRAGPGPCQLKRPRPRPHAQFGAPPPGPQLASPVERICVPARGCQPPDGG